MTPTFKCHKLNNQMSVSRCLANQAKGLALFGPNAGKYQTCPCDQGIKIKEENQMGTAAVKKHCEDCGRTIYSGRFCSACTTKRRRAEYMGETIKEKVRVPAEVTETKTEMKMEEVKKIKKRPLVVCKECGREMPHQGRGMCGKCYSAWKKAAREAAAPEPKPIYDPFLDAPIPAEPAEKFVIVPVKAKAVKEELARSMVLALQIADDLDRKVLDFIGAEARRCRRTPEQQAMWMLQSHLPESSGEAA